MIHYIRARIKGICHRCSDGGDVEVCLAENGSYQECVYCRNSFSLTPEQAARILRGQLDKTDLTFAPKPVKKKKKKVSSEVEAVLPKKKKKKAPATLPVKKTVKKKRRAVV